MRIFCLILHTHLGICTLFGKSYDSLENYNMPPFETNFFLFHMNEENVAQFCTPSRILHTLKKKRYAQANTDPKYGCK